MWMNLIPIALLNPPSRLAGLGRTMMQLSLWLLFVGAVAKATLTVMSIATTFTQQSAAPTLIHLYPNLPTWWVPEGPVGFSFALSLFLVGLSVKKIAAHIERYVG